MQRCWAAPLLHKSGRSHEKVMVGVVPAVVLNKDFDVIVILRLPLPFTAIIATGHEA
jgi:hypothetical protein